MPLPKFVGIGAPRCGTRWLAEALAEHPEISVADGELYFFTKRRVVTSNWAKGLDWYSDLIQAAVSAGSVTWGEITPFYLLDQETPELMYDCIPHAKLICCLRDQSERAYSWYRLFLHFNPSLFATDYSFRRFLTYSNEVYGRDGFYLEHIMRYLEFYPRESLLVLLYDDLQSDPVAYIQNVYKFLGVDPSFIPKVTSGPTNLMELTVPRSKTVQDAAKRLQESRVLRKVRLAGLGETLERLNARRVPRTALPQRHQPDREIRKRMNELYQVHNIELGRFLGRDLSHWNTGRQSQQADGGPGGLPR